MSQPYLRLDEIKHYCRIDGKDSADDWLLSQLKESAITYMENAGIPYPNHTDYRYTLCLCAIILDLYDRRGLTESEPPSVNPVISNYMKQLKLEAEAERIVGEMDELQD